MSNCLERHIAPRDLHGKDFGRAHEAMKQESRQADHTRVAARLLYDGRVFELSHHARNNRVEFVGEQRQVPLA